MAKVKNLNARLSEFTMFDRDWWNQIQPLLDANWGKPYTYIIYDTEKNRPHYVGEGKKNRVHGHFTPKSGKSTFTSVELSKLDCIVFIRFAKTKQFALDLEESLIDKWGRVREGGILVNVLDKGYDNSYRMSQQDFELKMEKVHGNLYFFGRYTGFHDKMEVTCRSHGLFIKTPAKLSSGQGCPLCGYRKTGSKLRENPSEYFAIVERIHNGFYTYHSGYTTSKSTLKITCPIHGDFYQRASHHKSGHGCKSCAQKVGWETRKSKRSLDI